MSHQSLENSSITAARDIRVNGELSQLHARTADLLRKIARGVATQRDLAMASIYAEQLDRRRARPTYQRN